MLSVGKCYINLHKAIWLHCELGYELFMLGCETKALKQNDSVGNSTKTQTECFC